MIRDLERGGRDGLMYPYESRPEETLRTARKAFAGAETTIAQEADNFGRGRVYPRYRVSTDLIRQHAEHLARRVLQEAIKESTIDHWLRRADELEQVGTRWADKAALECRRHAWLLAHLDDSEVAA